jgi:GR25 family glycosyltransferase involved in LPS biosynthesis
MRKFENFPQVCYLSLKESSDRRENLHNQFINYKIQNVKSIISNRFPNQIHNDNILSGEFIDTLTNQSKGNLISHMEALNLMTSKISEFDYFFVCEDDLSFETVQYWNFNWNEFIGELPNDWDIVQLLVIRDDFNNKLGLRKREWNDWSAAAYIIKNDYAKKLLNKHLKEIYEFNLEINGVKLQPLIENILYTQTENCYSIPLFVEEVNKFESTIINNDDTKDGSLKINGQGKSHITSYNEVINWWRTRNMKMENTLIEEYALNTENPEKNYDLAKWYHKQQQTAAAISYYL